MKAHHTPPTRSRTHFEATGSPLNGKRIPMDWAVLDFKGKVTALIRVGYAANWTEGCRMLGQHAAAINRERKHSPTPKSGPVDDLSRRQQRASRWWDR